MTLQHHLYLYKHLTGLSILYISQLGLDYVLATECCIGISSVELHILAGMQYYARRPISFNIIRRISNTVHAFFVSHHKKRPIKYVSPGVLFGDIYLHVASIRVFVCLYFPPRLAPPPLRKPAKNARNTRAPKNITGVHQRASMENARQTHG